MAIIFRIKNKTLQWLAELIMPNIRVLFGIIKVLAGILGFPALFLGVYAGICLTIEYLFIGNETGIPASSMMGGMALWAVAMFFVYSLLIFILWLIWQIIHVLRQILRAKSTSIQSATK